MGEKMIVSRNRNFFITLSALVVCSLFAVTFFGNQDTPNHSTCKPAVRSLPKYGPGLYCYPCEVLRVIDGDTYEVRFRVWQDITLTKKLRLLDVDCPELHPRKGTTEEREAERKAAVMAKQVVIEMLSGKVRIVTDWKSDPFGRILAAVEYDKDDSGFQDLGKDLLRLGYAKPYSK